MSAKTIRGVAYVLGDNIDTDQILTAEYLKINPSSPEGYAQLASLAMCGLPEGSLPFIDPQTGKSPYSIVIGGQNFGCGSSREHAVVTLGAAGVRAVIAQSYARIFFRNCVSTGQLLPVVSNARLCDQVKTGDVVEIVVDEQVVRCESGVADAPIEPVGELANIVEAGGLFAYARAVGKIPAREAAEV
ncbi:3-isopropylmalate dehydratase [Paraburkholderia xenovorans]|uniref:LeuD/DmdB family oxidoreductase small subunit n=1 Tax=Paraburkholderia xenovorans TaxID=36873 RepID=UPI0015C53971|nr:3-isopropylmalate dehydratase [Paraburkholderia xenovorans]NPT35376.1 3-isopropylmalate dehydratase [Paraburkholderia xenovorans]